MAHFVLAGTLGGGEEAVQLLSGGLTHSSRGDCLAFPARQGLRNVAVFPERIVWISCREHFRADGLDLQRGSRSNMDTVVSRL